MGNLIQAKLSAHTDNPFRDNLWSSVGLLSCTSGNLLVTQDNLTLNKANLVPSKATLLDKLVSLKFNKDSQLSNLLNHLVSLDSLRLHKVNPIPSKSKLLGKWANLNQTNLLARWLKLYPLRGHPSGPAQPGTQMIVASQAPPGFQPQFGLQTQSSLQL